MADKKMLAYQVGENYEGHAVIVFASSSVAARRKGANELNIDFEDVDSCRRARWADQYAGTTIPVSAYFDAGWWFECFDCGKQVDGETEGHVIDGERVYCNSGCQHDHQRRVDEQNKAFEEFKAQICKSRPDLQFTAFSGEWPCITLSAEFMFDGAKYGGHVRREKGEDRWFIANGDREAWEAYEAAQKAQHRAESGKGIE